MFSFQLNRFPFCNLFQMGVSHSVNDIHFLLKQDGSTQKSKWMEYLCGRETDQCDGSTSWWRMVSLKRIPGTNRNLWRFIVNKLNFVLRSAFLTKTKCMDIDLWAIQIEDSLIKSALLRALLSVQNRKISTIKEVTLRMYFGLPPMTSYSITHRTSEEG